MPASITQKLSRKNNWNKDEFVGELTRDIDQNYKGHINKDRMFCHYVLDVRDSMDKDLLVIRIPGRTVGEIRIDDNNVITKLIIDKDYHPNNENPRYPDDINQILSKYIGKKLELDGEWHE